MLREYEWQKIEEPTDRGALFQGQYTGAVYIRDWSGSISSTVMWYETDKHNIILDYVRGFEWEELLRYETRLTEVSNA